MRRCTDSSHCFHLLSIFTSPAPAPSDGPWGPRMDKAGAAHRSWEGASRLPSSLFLGGSFCVTATKWFLHGWRCPVVAAGLLLHF